MRQPPTRLPNNPASWSLVLVFLVVSSWPLSVGAIEYTLISPTAIVAGPNSRVAGAKDVAPKMRNVSSSRLVRSSLPVTISVTGTNFSPDDTFKLNRRPVSRRFISTRKVHLTIPVSGLAYKSYALRLIHQGQEVDRKKLSVVRSK